MGNQPEEQFSATSPADAPLPIKRRFSLLDIKPNTGVYIVYDYDVNAYPIMIFDTELEAHRYRNNLGYGRVKFWEFGTKWED